MKKRVIELKEYKKLDLRGGILIDGFPSIGLISTIISNYYISTFNLDCIAVIDSRYFPPMSMIFANKPKFPARIHASEDKKLAVISAEFSPNQNLSREIGKMICKWAINQRISRIVTIEGFLEENKKEMRKEHDIWVVGSTENARKMIERANLPQLGSGIVLGIPAIILNECKWLNIDAFCFIAKIHGPYPEFRAAGKIIEMLNKLIPEIFVEAKPLYEEAERIESKLKEMRKEIKTIEQPPSLFYR